VQHHSVQRLAAPSDSTPQSALHVLLLRLSECQALQTVLQHHLPAAAVRWETLLTGLLKLQAALAAAAAAAPLLLPAWLLPAAAPQS
jgi:hypothetical protein